MDRREFTKVMGAVAAGMLAGSKAFADDKAPAKKAAKAAEKHVCKGMNGCKGEGAGGKNECKGKGGCATMAKHSCATKNSCKGKGGCEVPMSEAHMKALKDKDKAGKSSCKGKSGCKGR